MRISARSQNGFRQYQHHWHHQYQWYRVWRRQLEQLKHPEHRQPKRRENLWHGHKLIGNERYIFYELRRDRKFIMEATMGGMKEVESGRVAATKATNPEVKKFAEMMVDEHSKVNDELKTLAASKGVTCHQHLMRSCKRL
ncbi:MAG: DUF4142 domain-containing protein [Pyrinomonadaceae bacterium]